ncbi:MAG: glucosaminidase domain-containing protein [Bacteroidota bacterium]
MKKVIGLFFLSITLQAHAGGEKQLSKKEYVEQWRSTAVQQMIQFKIPASITMAQAILESGNGNSNLAQKGNNHFGIKCHDWEGEKMYMDDDAANECFRVYNSAEESFVDHSLFLTEKKRYSKLFELEQSDYKAWAKGLKEAGYATNPKYPELLIGLIEELKLAELDQLGIQNNEIQPSIASSGKIAEVNVKHSVYVHENKKVKYIVAKKGDTFYRIANEFGLTLSQLHKYNDFDATKDVLVDGDLVYIHPKKAKSKNKSITLTKNMSVNEIAQKEAVKSKKIKKFNDIDSPATTLKKGEKVILR